MSHVDEGTLHAYLDGALDEYPADEAERVRSHLETCEECREMLARERRVRSRATEILGFAAPDVEVPTFEELRAYVRANEPARTTRGGRLYKMSWAASVVLALGTGWLLRDGQLADTAARGALRPSSPAMEVAPTPLAESVNEVVEAEPAAAEDAILDREATAATLEAPGAGAPRSQTEVVARPEAPREPAAFADDADAGRAVAPETVGTDDRAYEPERIAGLPAAAAASVPDATLAEAQDDAPADAGQPAPVADASDAALRDEVVTAPAPSASADAVEPLGAQRQVAQEDRARRMEEARLRSDVDDVVVTGNVSAAAPGLGTMARGIEVSQSSVDAEADTSDPLVIPQLEVLDVVSLGDGTVPEGTRVLQRLENGDTLELLHVPDYVDLAELPEAGPDRRELLVRRPSGWLFLRAPRTDAELATLLQRLLEPR